jgi:small-conductance mechanosensitive channel
VSSVWSEVGDFVDRHFDAVVHRPIRVVGIIVAALILRALAHRIINRMANAGADGSVPTLLRPLRDRAANAGLFGDAAVIGERRRQRAETIASVLRSAASFALFVIAVLYIVDELGFSLAPLLAGTSIVGVAVGFGAQNIIKDFLGGMFMILEDQYGVGDVVDLKEATGTVEAVGLRTTRLRDERGTVWYMRNGEIVRVGNQSQGFAQVVLDVPVKPDGDVARAQEALRDIASEIAVEPEWEELFLEPPRVQGIQSIALDATTIRLVARVRPLEQWRVARELRWRIRQRLDAAAEPAGDRAAAGPAAGSTAGSTGDGEQGAGGQS